MVNHTEEFDPEKICLRFVALANGELEVVFFYPGHGVFKFRPNFNEVFELGVSLSTYICGKIAFAVEQKAEDEKVH